MIGRLDFFTKSAISPLSYCKPQISFIIFAPAFIAASATSYLYVSIEIIVFKFLEIFSIIGTTLDISSSDVI